MRRMVVTAALALAAARIPASAGGLEDSLETRWRGAWVVTTADTYSDCAGSYTRNNINGELVRSKGQFRFRRGEIAQVKDFDLERSGLELSLSLPEPLLVSSQDGPFTLYDEARCLMNLDLELPRKLVSGKDLTGIETALQQVVIRFSSQEQAMRSRAWNHREREPYPEDYDRTIAEHAAWKAEQANSAIQARIDEAAQETTRIADRVNSDPDYLQGFAAGVEAVRAMDLTRCGEILSRSFKSIVPRPPELPAATSEAERRSSSGFQDGARLVFGLESMRRLPGCFVPVPEVPDDSESSADHASPRH